MPAIAHIGIGLAAKKIAPDINVWILILAAEFIEIVFFILYFAGIEIMPTNDLAPFTPYSHSLFMGIVWSIFVSVITYIVSRNNRTSVILGLLVFSHTILDIIASPKLAFYPKDLALPIFFDYSKSVGLGLWSSSTVAAFGEFGIVILGLGIYIHTRLKIKSKTTL